MLLPGRLAIWLMFVTTFIAAALIISGPEAGAQAKAALVDLNTASQQDLEALKGIGPAAAKKIIAARPYKSVADLAKAGLSAKQMETLKPLVTVGPGKEVPPAAAAPPKQVKAAEPAKLIDLNTASPQELEALKGVGPAAAKKIIAARPYKSVDDLAKAGLPAKTTAALKPLVTVAPSQPMPSPPSPPAKAAPAPTPATPAAPAPPKAEVPASPKAGAPAAKLAPGQLVNINTASKEMLEALPEIGPVKAQAIIDNRPYKKIEDVMKVKGIKEGTFEQIKGMITVN